MERDPANERKGNGRKLKKRTRRPREAPSHNEVRIIFNQAAENSGSEMFPPSPVTISYRPAGATGWEKREAFPDEKSIRAMMNRILNEIMRRVYPEQLETVIDEDGKPGVVKKMPSPMAMPDKPTAPWSE